MIQYYVSYQGDCEWRVCKEIDADGTVRVASCSSQEEAVAAVKFDAGDNQFKIN